MVKLSLFGVTRQGAPVTAVELQSGNLRCRVLNFGATLQSLWVPDRQNRPTDVVLGYDTLEEYETQDGYLGATVGRYANRIAGGQFALDGTRYQLRCNDGENHLHGGRVGFSHRIWEISSVSDQSVLFSLDSPAGEEGYPGHLQVQVRYTLRHDALELSYFAKSDAPTPCNLTNHSYFNLEGQGSGPVLEHVLQIAAERYTPSNAASIPTGELAPVAGTPMDFRQAHPIGAQIERPFLQLQQARGYDHNYVLPHEAGTLYPAATLWAPQHGIRMEVQTTMPGVQLYTANFLTDGRRGKGGAQYAPRHAVCLETQFYPDSPNHPDFPDSILRPEKPYQQTTIFQFGVQD